MKITLFSFLFLVHSFLIASDLGKDVYDLTCKTCHAPQIATGMHAPTAFNKQAWSERFEKAAMESKKNPNRFKTAIDYLLYKVKIGKGLMPHAGLCKEADVPKKDCSNKAIIAAIYYMAGIQSSH